MAKLIPFIEGCPNLLRIDIPEDYLDLDSDDLDVVDTVTAILTARAADRARTDKEKSTIPSEEVGIFTTETSEEQGVGLKRSLIYPG
jgi:hypothetical protein